MSLATTTSMIGIVQNVTMGVISRDKAIAHLLELDLPTNENKFKKCIIDLIRKLPPVPIVEDIKEFELSTLYVDPFLSDLFDAHLVNRTNLRRTSFIIIIHTVITNLKPYMLPYTH